MRDRMKEDKTTRGKLATKKAMRGKKEHWREQQKTKRASLFLFLLITEGDDSII